MMTGIGERMRIIAWLREMGTDIRRVELLADLIERGAHLSGTKATGTTEDNMREVHAKRVQPSDSAFNVVVDCPFCGKEERHGNVRDNDWRIAHCAVSDVPAHDGYRIRVPQVGDGV